VSTDELQTWLANSNVRAWLRVIRQGESSQDDSAYREINGGGFFDAPPWRHPYEGIPTTRGGKAAGAYQFLGTTWARLQQQFGFADFSPINQDLGAVALIAQRQALSAVMAGGVAKAIELLKDEWVSLPAMGATLAEHVFTEYGGTVGAQSAPATPDAPTQQPPTQSAPAAPMGSPMPLLLALLPAVLNLFAPRAQAALQKVTGASPDVVGQFAQTVIDKVQEVTGKPDPVQAVAAITADPKPEHVEAVQETAMDHLDKLLPVLDKLAEADRATWDAEESSRDDAAKRGQADAFDLAPMLAAAAIALVFFCLLALLTIMGIQAWKLEDHEPTTAMYSLLGPLLGVVFTGAFAAVYAYRFGSSRSSSAKDVILGQLAKK